MAGSSADGGRDFDDLLMAALHGAIALVEMEDVAVAIAEDLDFDVAGAADVAFEEDGVIAEGGFGFAAGLFETAGEIGGAVDDAHAASAAAEGRFDDQRKADLGGGALGLFGGGDGFWACRARRGRRPFARVGARRFCRRGVRGVRRWGR